MQNRAFSLYFIGPHSSYIFHNADASLVKTNCNFIFMGHFRIFYLVYFYLDALYIYFVFDVFVMMILGHLIALLRSCAAVTNIVQYFWHLLVRTIYIYIYWHLFLALRFFWQVGFFFFSVFFFFLRILPSKLKFIVPLLKQNTQKRKKR